MRRRQGTAGLGVAVLVAASLLASAAPAWATGSSTTRPPAHHHPSTKASVNYRTACKDLKAQQSSQSGLGLGLARALQSGRVDRAKQGMLRVLDSDLHREGTASGALKSTPRQLQNAEKRLGGDIERVKVAVGRATNIKGLLAAFSSLGHNTHLTADGLTVANWYDAHCSKPHPPATPPPPTTTATSLPGTPSGTSGSGGTP